jgi:hypothetical protein
MEQPITGVAQRQRVRLITSRTYDRNVSSVFIPSSQGIFFVCLIIIGINYCIYFVCLIIIGINYCIYLE